MPVPRPTFDEWYRATADLLPRGQAWPREVETDLGRLIAAVAGERQRVHGRALQLLDFESFPGTAAELLPEWEEVAGLPDPCRPIPGTIAARRLAVTDTLFGAADPTPAFFIALAASLGYAIEIVERLAFVAGVSAAGDPVGEDDHEWEVVVGDQIVEFFTGGASAGGEPLWTFPDLDQLICLIRRAAPAHTRVTVTVPA